MGGRKSSKKNMLFSAVRVILAVGIAFFLCQIKLDYLESLTYDLRTRLRPASPVSGNIQTIAIDTRTQESLKRHPEAVDHIKLLENLAAAQPRAVVYTLDPVDIIGSYEELEKLAEVSEKLRFYVAADDRLPVKGLEEDFILLPPLQDIKVVSAPKTSDANTFAKDNVTRRLIYSFQGEPLLHAQLASEINGLTENNTRGLFKFKRTTQGIIDFRDTGTYKPVSFLDVMDGNADPKKFRGKIVLIGRDTKSEIEDYILSPFSRDILAMSKVEMHANAIDTLILNRSPVKAPKWLDVLFTSIISVLTVFIVLKVRPAKGLFILGLTMAGFILFSYLILSFYNVWIGMAHPFIAIFICYYFFIPYRLIMENRRSWEYYQKNAILTQVEELKSNFLRMMSHDLKTPIARIQGMTDIVLRDNSTMSEQQSTAVKSIKQSSEELEDFIGSILNLGRIESKDVKLQLKSKDVNTLLKEVVQRAQFLAKQKNIEIITEFEPLFSVKVDEDLMRQVFTNLVENAIKYSGENTKILVSTEELNGRVVVQVADQGVGIPGNEIDNVFTKFFRSSEVKDSEVKGSGLGLYLAKYFVDLHNGNIAVESQPHKGSTFTVDLPMDL